MSKQVLIVDDHFVIREGVRAMLAGTDLVIANEASNATEAFKVLEVTTPDVVLLDVRMEGTDGLKTLIRLQEKYPNLPVVLYSAHDNPTYLARSLALGAKGFVLKMAPRERLVEALQTAAAGEAAWTRDELRRVTGPMFADRSGQEMDVPLTHRESEVMRQMAHGLTNKEIAKMLSISYETVKEHVQHILRKLGVKDRTQAAVWAVKRKIV